MGKLQVNGAIQASGSIHAGNGIMTIGANGSISSNLATEGGWNRGWAFKNNNTALGVIGMYGNTSKINWFYVGTDYEAENCWMRVTPAGVVTAKTFSGALDGNASTATTLSATLAINKGGTGATTRLGAVNSLFYLGGNLITTNDQDKPSVWKEYGQGFAYFNDDVPKNETGVTRPETWMHILNIGPSGHALRTQLGFQAGGSDVYVRGGSSSSGNAFSAWYKVLTTQSTVTVAQGGTGITSNPSMLVNLASTTADTVFEASPRPGVTGTLKVANGGTGITSNPSMLVNLGSTTADTVFEASPRPGITGTLGVANGGTGATTFTSGAALIGAGTGAVTTRAITNNTTISHAGWSSSNGTNLITLNTLAYWNGQYASGKSNLTKVGTIDTGVWQGTKIGIAYGGTNATTAKGAEYNIIMKDSEASTSDITDTTQFVFKYVTPSATNGVLYYRAGSYIWDYIKGKSDSTYLKLAGGTMAGTITSQHITPKTSNAYNLGTVDAPWYQIITRRLYLFDGTNEDVNYGRFIVTTQGTTSAQGIASLYVGNANGAKTAGGAYGQVIIYGEGAGYATLRATASATAATTHYLPTTGGTLLNTATYSSYALPLAGGSMTGTIKFPTANMYYDFAGKTGGAIAMNNGDIGGVNCIYFSDEAGTNSEGLMFWRSATTVDNVHAKGGVLYFGTNYDPATGTSDATHTVLHSGNYSSYAVPKAGGTMTGNLIITNSSSTSTTARYVEATNANGSVRFQASTNRGVYDVTGGGWMVYSKKADTLTTRIPNKVVLENSYGTIDQRNKVANPVAGQVFFVTG